MFDQTINKTRTQKGVYKEKKVMYWIFLLIHSAVRFSEARRRADLLMSEIEG